MAGRKIITYKENKKVFRKLPEIVTFDTLIEEAKDLVVRACPIESGTICSVSGMGLEFPVKYLAIGNQQVEAPCLVLIGGIHGLERIGSQVVLTCLDAIIDRLRWDENTQQMLSKFRIVFVPIMNPIGIYRGIRSNGRGVDLMRNSPVLSMENPLAIIGGQRWSNKLPYYQGDKIDQMEPELNALMDTLDRFCRGSEMSLIADFHSGFGSMDQLWFPYAKTKHPFPHLAEVHALKTHFDESFPAHGYLVEPQALNYTTHGDLWDYVYDEYLTDDKTCRFLPLTLEMGSWYWILKNPVQILSRHGFFNPLNHKIHDEVLRNHLVFFDFLLMATGSYKKWARLSEPQKVANEKYAKELWYAR